jgi:hypothetical protein
VATAADRGDHGLTGAGERHHDHAGVDGDLPAGGDGDGGLSTGSWPVSTAGSAPASAAGAAAVRENGRT